MAIQDVLKGCPLFFDMFDEEIEKIVKDEKVHKFQQGDYIIKEGQKGQQIFVLLEGIATMQKSMNNGKLKIEKFKPGEIFGVMVLLDEVTYGIDVVANTTCYVLELDYDKILSLFKKDSEVFSLLALNLARLLAKRLKSWQAAVSSLNLAS